MSTWVTCGDTNPEGCTGSLGDIIEFVAEPGDTIVLSTGDYRTETYIPFDLTIEAADAVLREDINDGPLFRVYGPVRFVLRDATVSLGASALVEVSDGAEVWLEGGTWISDAVRLTGGFVDAEDATVHIVDVHLIGGGAIDGGQIYARNTDLFLQGTRHDGGRSLRRPPECPPETYCASPGGGGAVFVTVDDDSPHTLEVAGSIFRDNEASAAGGAIYAHGASVVLIGANLMANRAETGAGMAVVDGDVTMDGAYFTDNVATAVGGGVHVAGVQRAPRLVATSTWFATNLAKHAAALDALGVAASLDGLAFVGNHANGAGGAVVTDGGTTTIRRSWFCGNSGEDGAALAATGDLDVRATRFVRHSEGPVIAVDALTPVDVRVRNVDFVGNDGPDGALLHVKGSAAVEFAESLAAWTTRPTDARLVTVGPGTLDAHHNVFWDPDLVAPTIDGDAATIGVIGDPDLRGLDLAAACDASRPVSDYTASAVALWMDRAVPWPTWYGAGRDKGAEDATDRDGSRADVGAVGGPEAAIALWQDGDRDDYPAVYDCADGDPEIHPEADDTPYDDVDGDCDRVSDDDADEDGHDDVGQGGDDCLDGDATVNPSVVDVPNDTIDQDCDGDVDLDNDGWEWPEDCDDGNAAVHPGVIEDAGAVDRDCDGIGDAPFPLVPAGCATAPAPAGLSSIAVLLAVARRSRRR